MNQLEQLNDMLKKSQYIVFFGGAGVSTESGIPDFRSEVGIYKTRTKYGRSPEEILSHTFFMAHPKEFYEFYRSNMIFVHAKPNKAHLALAKLENEGLLKAVITQNIDGLHQLAGSKEVLELHGTIHRNCCMKCKKSHELDYILDSQEIPICQNCGSIVKPDVTLYEESLNMQVMTDAIGHLQRADMLIVGGTSLAVYPAAGLIDYYNGDRLILINKSETPYDRRANLVIHDAIGKVLGDLTGI